MKTFNELEKDMLITESPLQVQAHADAFAVLSTSISSLFLTLNLSELSNIRRKWDAFTESMLRKARSPVAKEEMKETLQEAIDANIEVLNQVIKQLQRLKKETQQHRV